jgi:hypothetical protein
MRIRVFAYLRVSAAAATTESACNRVS